MAVCGCLWLGAAFRASPPLLISLHRSTMSPVSQPPVPPVNPMLNALKNRLNSALKIIGGVQHLLRPFIGSREIPAACQSYILVNLVR